MRFTWFWRYQLGLLRFVFCRYAAIIWCCCILCIKKRKSLAQYGFVSAGKKKVKEIPCLPESLPALVNKPIFHMACYAESVWKRHCTISFDEPCSAVYLWQWGSASRPCCSLSLAFSPSRRPPRLCACCNWFSFLSCFMYFTTLSHHTDCMHI